MGTEIVGKSDHDGIRPSHVVDWLKRPPFWLSSNSESLQWSLVLITETVRGRCPCIDGDAAFSFVVHSCSLLSALAY